MKKRAVGLDLMKFILCLMILFHHFQQLTGAVFERFNFWNGSVQVGYFTEVFFIISGLLTWLRRKSSDTTFGHFMKKRIVRLLPMVAVAAIVYSVVAFAYKAKLGYWFWDSEISLGKLLCSIFLVHSGGVSNVGFAANNPTWYICVLLICYAIFWLIMWLSRKLDVNPIWMTAFMSAVGLAIIRWGYDAPFFNASTGRGYAAFFVGGVLGRLVETVKEKYLVLASIAAMIIFAAFAVIDISLIRAELYIAEVYFFFPALVLLFYFLPLPQSKIIQSLGAVSFEVYLWHVPFVLLLIFLNDYGVISVVYSVKTMMALATVVVAWSSIMYFTVEGRINNSFANFIEKIRK